MNEGNNPAKGITELKAPGNISQHGDPRKNHSENRLLLKVLPHFCPDHFNPSDLIRPFTKGSIQWFFYLIGQHLGF